MHQRMSTSDDPDRHAVRVGVPTQIAFASAVLAYNVAVNRLIPRAGYVPANLAAALLAVAAARWCGVPPADMGLRHDRLGRGLRVGLVAALLIVAAIALAVAVPATRIYLADRAIGGGTGHVAYELLVRVPLGTALSEELIFRGAMLGLFLQRHPRRVAVAMSSLVFGFWHVLPTLETLHLNAVGSLNQGGALRTGGAVLVSVLTTTAAGWGFAWLRFRSDSILAPILTHASVNASALFAGRLTNT
jgi:membrane protease YdiL (CAAX protease family)